jgi:hypothetical protein
MNPGNTELTRIKMLAKWPPPSVPEKIIVEPFSAHIDIIIRGSLPVYSRAAFPQTGSIVAAVSVSAISTGMVARGNRADSQNKGIPSCGRQVCSRARCGTPREQSRRQAKAGVTLVTGPVRGGWSGNSGNLKVQSDLALAGLIERIRKVE